LTSTTYSKYLRLKELLSLQHPLTPPDQQEVHDSERLFIVVHQVSEVLLGQALTDLRHVAADRCGERCFARRAERARHLIDALEEQVALLHRALDPRDFLRFRDRFGSASGLQSAQFHELFRLTEQLSSKGGHHDALERRQVAELRAAVRRWRSSHLKMVEHMIGDQPGSGDTSGVRYLERRLNASSHDDADSATALPRTSS
jgi:tryptophan 2,3-dioxygenase